MTLNATKILGISITTSDRLEILENIKKYLQHSKKTRDKSEKFGAKPLTIVTPNPEQIVLAQRDAHFASILNSADIALPDGVGVVWAMNRNRFRIEDSRFTREIVRIPGVEFMEDLVGLAEKEGVSIGLIGGRGGIALKAFECLQKKYPKLKGYVENGPEVQIVEGELGLVIDDLQSTNNNNAKNTAITVKTKNNNRESQTVNRKSNRDFFIDQVAHTIVHSGVRMIFIGLGAPKQEYILELLNYKLQSLHYSVILMVVGGSFDIVSGAIERAPKMVRELQLEWFWRLCREPWRVKRQIALFQFVSLIFKDS
jgi:N-acetylglucosaminyldiphosphoundecaprenol N-acetyl-beta-D-mannosaminyltransferase